ncbi:YfhJ family protein [Rossellomorea marisflavi]|uniref:YfhJ family protein n=1 Tax=Rossellomorea marisflavi TaxID=189381 RepID=UPI001EE2FA15|nr:YfhJ family protein [Rossellomorea marisflavi]UKS66640.1 YfhJ family protein [Rossellomorea marisflavi]
MESIFHELTQLLMDENSKLTYEKARTWVELVWEDFETTYAKAGYEYKGKEVTEKVVRQWIATYGTNVHDFAARNPKYSHLLDDGDHTVH